MGEIVCVFDLDDTLYLERDYVRSGFLHVGRLVEQRLGVAGVGEHAWSLFEQGVRGSTFDRVVERFELPADSRQVMIDAYRAHEPSVRLLPDAARLLDALPRSVVATGIVTDGPAASQRAKLRALGLESTIDEIVVTAEHGAAWTKPGEPAFLRMQARFGDAADFVYFGDNPAKDFQAPRALGWSTVRVRRPLGLHHAVAGDVPADLTIVELPDPSQLEDAVLEATRRRGAGA